MSTMTSDEWLEKYEKFPWNNKDGSYFAKWVWLTDMGYHDIPKPPAEDEYHCVLPWVLFNCMEERITYPMCKNYKTLEQAIEDFKYGFNKAVFMGWNPETTPTKEADNEAFLQLEQIAELKRKTNSVQVYCPFCDGGYSEEHHGACPTCKGQGSFLAQIYGTK